MARRGAAVLAAFAAVLPASACGSGDDPAPAGSLVVSTRDAGTDEVVLKAPTTVAAGPIDIELRNRGDILHDAQLFRVEGERSVDDVVGALELPDPNPRPRWLEAAGGVAPVRPSETARVRQVLEPGTYYVADTQERPGQGVGKLVNAGKGGIAKFEVVGDAGDGSLPATPASITARDYAFVTDGIVAGPNRVTFRNEEKEFHQVVAFPVPRGVPFREGQRAILEREAKTGWVPVDVPHDRATAVLGGGGELATTLTFRPGRYLLLCFVTDHAGGLPQWTIGMKKRLEVPAR